MDTTSLWNIIFLIHRICRQSISLAVLVKADFQELEDEITSSENHATVKYQEQKQREPAYGRGENGDHLNARSGIIATLYKSLVRSDGLFSSRLPYRN